MSDHNTELTAALLKNESLDEVLRLHVHGIELDMTVYLLIVQFTPL